MDEDYIVGRTVRYNGRNKIIFGGGDTFRLHVGQTFTILDVGRKGKFLMLRLPGIRRPVWAGSFDPVINSGESE